MAFQEHDSVDNVELYTSSRPQKGQTQNPWPHLEEYLILHHFCYNDFLWLALTLTVTFNTFLMD